MSNPFDDVRTAVVQAEEQLRAADGTATDLARLLKGRLRHVRYSGHLVALKRELRDFNIHTRGWKP